MSDQEKNDAKRWRTRGRELEELNAGLAQRAIEDTDTIAALRVGLEKVRREVEHFCDALESVRYPMQPATIRALAVRFRTDVFGSQEK